MGKTKEAINRIGLDRTVVSSFRIVEIDFKKLQRHDNVELDMRGNYLYWLRDGGGFRWLKITDHKMFGIMRAGVRKLKHAKQDYSRMDITIGDTIYGNLQNETVVEYQGRIERVFRYLYVEYGILVDAQSLKFSEMEVNCTFELAEEFYKYHRVLRLMMFNLPASFKKIGQVSGVNKKEQRIEAETFYRGNAVTEVKIYDKKKQLEQKKHTPLQDNVLRIEFVLKKTQKIKEAFQSAAVADLTDEKLNKFYYEQFVKLFEKPYRKWQIENGKQLKRLILDHKQRNRIWWKVNLFRECANKEQSDQVPQLLDVKDLLVQIKALEKKGHYTRVAKGILEQSDYNDVFFQNDSDKSEEIIGKVHEAYDYYLKKTMLVQGTDSPTNGEAA